MFCDKEKDTDRGTEKGGGGGCGGGGGVGSSSLDVECVVMMSVFHNFLKYQFRNCG